MGATTLIAVIGGAQVHALGSLYGLGLVGLSPVLMLIVALLVNNIYRRSSYPEF